MFLFIFRTKKYKSWRCCQKVYLIRDKEPYMNKEKDQTEIRERGGGDGVMMKWNRFHRIKKPERELKLAWNVPQDLWMFHFSSWLIVNLTTAIHNPLLGMGNWKFRFGRRKKRAKGGQRKNENRKKDERERGIRIKRGAKEIAIVD